MGDDVVTKTHPSSCSIVAILEVANGKRKWVADLVIGVRPLLPKDSLEECESWFLEIDISGITDP